MCESTATVYKEIELKLATLTREFQDTRVKRVLMGLAKMREKDRYIRELENQLSVELATMSRQFHINTILELLENEDDVMRSIIS